MKIRKALAKDAHALSKTIRKSYQTVADLLGLTDENCPRHPSNCSDDWITADLDRGVVYYLLEAKESVFGCVALEKADEQRCYLERLSVLPEKRHQGYGRRLVEHVFMEARSIGCQSIGIGIIAKQQELKTWYKGLGFIEGETKNFEHLPFQVLFMECHLK